jgi:single-stranded DNA-specific DHH superfamily exonuclease
MLTEKELDTIKNQLEKSSKPIYFFDDDPDGIAAFLLMYKYRGEGKGVIIKARSKITITLGSKASEYGADRIFILDIPEMDEEFQEKLNTPTTWIDHHDVVKTKKIISYFNPKIKDKDAYIPTSYLCYKALKNDIWIAAVGCIGDYYLPEFMGEIKEKYPELIGEANIEDIGDIKYNSKLGTITRMFSFLAMGPTQNAMTNIKILTRIEDPAELLNKKTSRGKLLYKYFKRIDAEYQEIVKDAMKTKIKDGILFYHYSQDKISLTKDLANELTYRFKEVTVIVCREKNGELKMSLRRQGDIKTPFLKVLESVNGYGGGHIRSCGGAIKVQDKEKFIELLGKELKKS